MPRDLTPAPKTPARSRSSTPTGTALSQGSQKKRKLVDVPPLDLHDHAGKENVPDKEMYGSIEDKTTLRITPERLDMLRKSNIRARDYICDHIDGVDGYLEVVGWSEAKPGGFHLPESFYEVFDQQLPVKRLALRGPGQWHSCHCPDETPSKFGDQIDTSGKKNLHLEHIHIYRPFSISPCVLLDLISRSPNLKTVRNYGALFKAMKNHYQRFETVRFPSNLEAVYWPWCNKKYHLPTLKTIVSRHDQITTFYCDAETTCDFISADRLLNVKYLSLILNEEWNYLLPDEDIGDVAKNDSISLQQAEAKAIKMRNKRLKKLWLALPDRTNKLGFLSRLKDVEALEIRTFEVTFSDEEDDQIANEKILESYETYQLKFWECVSKMRSLKYLAVYGTWDFDKVARELAKHGMQIEYLKSNLYPGSLIQALKDEEPLEDRVSRLNMIDSTRHLVKLAKLKSFHYMCQELLADFAPETKTALKDISDFLWKMDCRVTLTQTVEECISQILRRGNQSGRAYLITLVLEVEDGIRFSFQTEQKFSVQSTIKERLIAAAQSACKKRGFQGYKFISLYGIEQAGGRERGSYDQLKAVWDSYDELLRPMDRYV